MTRTIEFVYYLFWVGVPIGALHLADVRPWTERFALILWPILIGVRSGSSPRIYRRSVVGANETATAFGDLTNASWLGTTILARAL